MSEHIYKKGLYEKPTLDVDIPASRYKNYEYTKKDFIDSSYKDKIPFLFIESTLKKIKLENGVLTIDHVKNDISKLSIKEVLDTFNNEGVTVQILDGSDIFTVLPSIFLSNFSNVTVTKIDGDISPLSYKYKVLKNKTIYSVDDIITNINVIDINKNKVEPFSIIDDNLFYVVGKYVKCYIKTVASSFYIFGDTHVKQILDGAFVANLSNKIINNKEVI